MNYLRQTIDYARFHRYDVGSAVSKYSIYQTDIMKQKKKIQVLPSDDICKQAHEKVREDIIKAYIKNKRLL